MAANPIFCTADDVGKLLSSEGVSLRIDDDPSTLVDAIEEASAEVWLYVGLMIDETKAKEVPILKFIARFYAARNLFFRRGESPPESWNERYKEFEAKLQAIQKGELQLANTPSHVSGPAVSVQTVNPQAFPSLMVSQARSSTKIPTKVYAPEHRYSPPR